MLRQTLRFLILGALVLTCGGVHAQFAPQNTSAIALQIIYHPDQRPALLVAEAAHHWIWFGRFGHVTNWKRPADSLPVDAVKVDCEAAENGTRVWVSVYLGKLHEEEKQVSSYILHEGDKVTVRELSEIGVLPFEIKVIRISVLPGDTPTFVSDAKSIGFVSMQRNSNVLPSYKVAVRNLSNKNVLAVRILTGTDLQLTKMPRGEEGAPLISPNGSYEFDAQLSLRSTPTGDTYSIETPANQVVKVFTVVFADGSFEGDAEGAVSFTSLRKGEKTQLRRIVELLEQCLSSSDSSVSLNLAWLKTQVRELGIEADPAAVDEVSSRFGVVPGIPPSRMKTGIEIGLTQTRTEVAKEIGLFQIRARRADAKEIRDWLTANKERYAAWAARL